MSPGLPPESKKRAASFRGQANPLAVAVNERDRNIMVMVHTAIRNKQAMLAFQPVVSAADPKRVAFYEALIRIRDATGRIIPAKHFINEVETTELGRMIDCLSLELAIKELEDVPNLRLSVNLSARSIGYPDWMATLDRGLARNPTVGERLILEITESSAITVPDLVTNFMDNMQAKGVAFALDDFGAGYTSFRYLRDFFFDVVKFDGTFIRGIHQDPDNQALMGALVSIGRHFEMITVAEMVEHEAEAEYLRSIGVDCIQGYLYGVPTISPSWRSVDMRHRA